jgi:hypothetical protein
MQWCRATITEADGSAGATWVLSGPGRPDLSAVDRLARCALGAARRGRRLVLEEVCPELAELLDLIGLCDLEGLTVEVQRETE